MRKIFTLWISGWMISLILFQFILSGCSNTPPRPPAKNEDSLVTPIEPITFNEMLQNPYQKLHLNREEYKGKVIYDHYCAVCHGETGDGNGFNAFNLESSFQVKPLNFTDSTTMANLTDEEIKRAIMEGGPAVGKSQYMPPWGYTLRGDEINAVIKYIHTFLRRKENQE